MITTLPETTGFPARCLPTVNNFDIFRSLFLVLQIFIAILIPSVELVVRYIYSKFGKWEWLFPKMDKNQSRDRSRMGMINNSNKTVYAIKVVVGL